MSRHFAVVTESVPHLHHGGGGVTAYSAIKAMVDRQCNVSLIALESSSYTGALSEADHIKHLESLGVRVFVLGPASVATSNSFLSSRLRHRLEDIFPEARRASEVAKLLRRISPEAIFMYSWGALAAVHGYHDKPKLGLVGDPVHLPYLFRKSIMKRLAASAGLRPFVRDLVMDPLRTRFQIRAMRDLLNECDDCGAFAAHHARFFEDMGVKNCRYFRTPVPDPLTASSQRRPPEKWRLLHIGHLRGTATLAGLELLASETLPALERELGPDGFELHLVGGYFETMPPELRKALSRPNVIVRGQVVPPDEEFLSSHAVIVPTPIELGIRVRIISAFSYGSAVIAHTANQKGIPELQDTGNALLASDGAGLARQCVNLFRNQSLRAEIEKNSRRTYDEHFSIQQAGGAIVDALLRCAA